MLIYKCTKDNQPKGEIKMLNDEICKLRDKLNRSIEEGRDYDYIYELSVKLDDLIAEFYGGKEK